jgi:hypothetical protein
MVPHQNSTVTSDVVSSALGEWLGHHGGKYSSLWHNQHRVLQMWVCSGTSAFRCVHAQVTAEPVPEELGESRVLLPRGFPGASLE